MPLFGSSGEVIGAVSVGIEYDSVRARLLGAIPGLLAYPGGALAVGALAAYLISRRLQRQTHDLAFSDISALLTEREAMLHGIREGVVALDGAGRVRLLNDEAQRLLGVGPEAAGRTMEEVLGDGRTADVLAGRVVGDDLLAVRGSRVLPANRMPTDDGGAVVTLRDRTELEHLGRELDSTTGLIDALRAQDHEHEQGVQPVREGVRHGGGGRPPGDSRAGHRESPGPAAGRPPRRQGGGRRRAWRLAAAGSSGARIEVGLCAEGRTVILEVRDSGPGVTRDQHASIFTEGWSTKDVPAHGRRGLGLALVRRLAERQGAVWRCPGRTGAVRCSRSCCRRRWPSPGRGP